MGVSHCPSFMLEIYHLSRVYSFIKCILFHYLIFPLIPSYLARRQKIQTYPPDSSLLARMDKHSNLPILDWPVSPVYPMDHTPTRLSHCGIAPRNYSLVPPATRQQSTYGVSDASLPKWPPDCHCFLVDPTLIK